MRHGACTENRRSCHPPRAMADSCGGAFYIQATLMGRYRAEVPSPAAQRRTARAWLLLPCRRIVAPNSPSPCGITLGCNMLTIVCRRSNRYESAFQLVAFSVTYTLKISQLAYAGCFNAARELERFSASFAGVLPDLSVAGDDARETYSLASGVATGARSRGGRAGSSYTGHRLVNPMASATGSGRKSRSRRCAHANCVTPA